MISEAKLLSLDVRITLKIPLYHDDTSIIEKNFLLYLAFIIRCVLMIDDPSMGLKSANGVIFLAFESCSLTPIAHSSGIVSLLVNVAHCEFFRIKSQLISFQSSIKLRHPFPEFL